MKNEPLQVELSDEPLRVNGDLTRLSQVVLNLLNNASKFTERGSIVLVGQLMATEPEGLLIRFEVRDTGIGVEPGQLARLFKPFERGRTAEARGAGLGNERRPRALSTTRHSARRATAPGRSPSRRSGRRR